jgi:hypothetical protein
LAPAPKFNPKSRIRALPEHLRTQIVAFVFQYSAIPRQRREVDNSYMVVSNIDQKFESMINITDGRPIIREARNNDFITVWGTCMAMIQTHLNAEFSLEIQHRRPLPKRYTWEIHRKGVWLSLEESQGEFGSWEEASQDGNTALKQFLERANSDPVGFFTRQ